MTVQSSPAIERARAFAANANKQLIGGQWGPCESGQTLDVFDPATAEVIGRVPASDKADIDRAVATARQAFESGEWPKMDGATRTRILWKIADLIEANADEFAALETLDNGKQFGMSRNLDVALTVEYFRYCAGWATKIMGTTQAVNTPPVPGAQAVAYTLREPVGVVGSIIPWNFPLVMAAWKIAPALAAGCTVVLKPAEETPLTALRLGELMEEAGLPPGVVNIVTGFGHQAGAALSNHPGIDKIAFTGSTEIGKLIGKAAVDKMTRFSLELGGKSPVIVFEDADPDMVVQSSALFLFLNQGQVCTCGSRLYAHKSVFDKVVGGIADMGANFKLGSGFDPDTQIGPLVSAKQQERVTGYIKSGLSQGARSAATWEEASQPGYFVKPTVLVDVDPSMDVVREEIFGPVLVAQPFEDLDEVARQANDTPYGLGASIFSNNLSRVHRLIPRLQAGTVWVNCHNMLDANLPFGGYKQSGIGREHAEQGILNYTETKSVYMLV